MEDFKHTVKKWLKTIGKDREWLASELQKPKRTIDNWLSPSYDGFPAKWYIRIKALIEESQKNSEQVAQPARTSPDTQLIILKFTAEEWSMIQEYKKRHPEANIEAIAEQSVIDWAHGVKTRGAGTLTSKASAVRQFQEEEPGTNSGIIRGTGANNVQNAG